MATTIATLSETRLIIDITAAICIARAIWAIGKFGLELGAIPEHHGTGTAIIAAFLAIMTACVWIGIGRPTLTDLGFPPLY